MKMRSVWENLPARGVVRSAGQIRYVTGKSSLGVVLLAQSDMGIVAVLVGERAESLLDELMVEFPQAEIVRGHREERRALEQVVEMIERPGLLPDLPLDLRGTAFQRRVWEAVRKIPLGHTSTYTEIARKIGAPKAMRAVGTACARCSLSILVPCHRVLRSDGTFNGGNYWTAARHGELIAREAAAARKP